MQVGRFSVAIALGSVLVVVTSPRAASGGLVTVTRSSELSLALTAGESSAAVPGTSGWITDTTTRHYMLVRFDLSALPSAAVVHSATLRLTRESGQLPDPYTVWAWAFQPGNDLWYERPEEVTGLAQRRASTGESEAPWRNRDGQPGSLEEAGSLYLGGPSSWSGNALELPLVPATVQTWLTGELPNNGLRVHSYRSISPRFYGSGAPVAADRPTLVLSVELPEPSAFVIAVAGAAMLRPRRRSPVRGWGGLPLHAARNRHRQGGGHS